MRTSHLYPPKKIDNYINHVVLVLDHSASMTFHAEGLIKVADDHVADLAQASQTMNQETRVTIYSFGSTVECLVYDMDVLRLPSIRDLYHVSGNTALIDATLLAFDDLAMTPEKYGDHAFLLYVLTDGEENFSTNSPARLAERMAKLPDNWTVAGLVPDQRGVFSAKRVGFPAGNVAVWNTTSKDGIVEVGRAIKQATDNYMTMRSTGTKSTTTLFSTGVTAVNKATVKAKLKALPKTSYDLVDVDAADPIREWVLGKGYQFLIGTCYYQLTKRESIQPQKNIAVLEKSTNKVYTGAEARDLLGLSKDVDDRVSPDFNPLFDIFVQSTSVNRKLVPGTKLLMFK